MRSLCMSETRGARRLRADLCTPNSQASFFLKLDAAKLWQRMQLKHPRFLFTTHVSSNVRTIVRNNLRIPHATINRNRMGIIFWYAFADAMSRFNLNIPYFGFVTPRQWVLAQLFAEEISSNEDQDPYHDLNTSKPRNTLSSQHLPQFPQLLPILQQRRKLGHDQGEGVA